MAGFKALPTFSPSVIHVAAINRNRATGRIPQ